MAFLEMQRGRYRAARSHLEESILISRAERILLSEARTRLILSILLAEQGRDEERLHQLGLAASVLDSSFTPTWFVSRVGGEFARAGEVERAQSILEVVQSRSNPERPEESSELHRLEGEMALASGNFERALELLELATREHRWALTLESLAHAALVEGEPGRAIAHGEAFLTYPDRPLSFEPAPRWLSAHLHLARVYAAEGDRERARALLDRLLDLWREGDPDLSLLREARALREELS